MALTVKQLREIADNIYKATDGLKDGDLIMTYSLAPTQGESKYDIYTYGGWVDLRELYLTGGETKRLDESTRRRAIIRRMCERSLRK